MALPPTATPTATRWDSAADRPDAGSPGGTASCGPTIAGLVESVEDLNLSSKIENGLLQKLAAAQTAFDADDLAGACDKLAAFISSVRAQSGKKKIATADANALITEADEVREALGCD